MKIAPRHILFTFFVCSLFSVPNVGCGGVQPTNVRMQRQNMQRQNMQRIKTDTDDPFVPVDAIRVVKAGDRLPRGTWRIMRFGDTTHRSV